MNVPIIEQCITCGMVSDENGNFRKLNDNDHSYHEARDEGRIEHIQCENCRDKNV